LDENGATNIHNGYSAGFSVELPLGKETNTRFGLDYAYVGTRLYNGTHKLGLRIDL